MPSSCLHGREDRVAIQGSHGAEPLKMHPQHTHQVSVAASEVPPRKKASNFPEPFASRMQGRIVRPLGEYFGLQNFGANLVTLAPGAVSAPRHSHSRQDEFVYVLAGEAMLITDAGEMQLRAGMCTGFPAGTGNAHQLVNQAGTDCVYLVIGDRSVGDTVDFPDDDLIALTNPDGTRRFARKDGTPYA
jgi:uncharacterized cupin superfamily protein